MSKELTFFISTKILRDQLEEFRVVVKYEVVHSQWLMYEITVSYHLYEIILTQDIFKRECKSC